MKRFRSLRAGIAVLSVVVLLTFGLPLIEFDSLAPGTRRVLERELGRKVEFTGGVRLHLLPWPGFSVEQVIIHDDPSMGLEPLAYISSLEVRLRLASLFGNRTEFSSLRLIEPSVNLVKHPSLGWNYPPLLLGALGGARSSGASLPRIEVRSGRVNFKFGLTKSVFYLSGTDVDVAPAGQSGNAVRVRFSGEPARTDRAAQGFGKLSGNGTLLLPPAGEPRLKAVLRLGRSAIAEILTLLTGHGVGWSGLIASRAELEGPVSNIAVKGNLELADVDRRFLALRFGSNWALDYAGRLDMTRQALALATRSSGAGKLPVRVRLWLRDYLQTPRWALTATAEGLPLATLPTLGREMGFEIPPLGPGSGTVDGGLSWSDSRQLQGSFMLRNVVLGEKAQQSLSVEQAWVKIGSGSIRLEPCVVHAGRGRRVRLSASYIQRESQLKIQLASEGMPVRTFRSAWLELAQLKPPPLLDTCEKGLWRGTLQCARLGDGPAAWSGKIGLQGAEFRVAGLSAPVAIASAKVRLEGGGYEMESIKGSVDGTRFQGGYRVAPGLSRRQSFDLKIDKAAAAELERLWEPALRRRQGFLARTLRLHRAPEPPWLKKRHVRGTFEIGTLAAGGIELESLRARLYWDGTTVNITRLTSGLMGSATLTGRVAIALGDRNPRYQATATVRDLPWESGKLTANGQLQTAGTGTGILLNASADGDFSLRRIRLAPEETPSNVTGCWELSMRRGAPRLRFPSLEIRRGGATYFGWGAVSVTGKIFLDVFNDSGDFRMSGTLFPLRLTPAVSQAAGAREQLR